jgi:putative SOS response-associated peptidase YedK
MRWGLVGFGSKGPDPKRATFNARADNLEKSGLWRVPLHKRRCLVPVSGFYEWRKPDKAASIIAAVRLARDENISRPSPRLATVITDCVGLARMILERVLR